jgi:hypothetical protein
MELEPELLAVSAPVCDRQSEHDPAGEPVQRRRRLRLSADLGEPSPRGWLAQPAFKFSVSGLVGAPFGLCRAAFRLLGFGMQDAQNPDNVLTRWSITRSVGGTIGQR